MNLVSSSIGPGLPRTDAAPEAGLPRRDSPKMDVYGYGILIVEMCLRELASSPIGERLKQEQMATASSGSRMVSLIGR